ncbi:MULTISPECIES: hypothetical protein [unclassified Variovorax]|uniref:hypothetical protein n=1 Tax=unclassified Variovorax TaxID=663243 RepID=UPI003F4467C8
MTSSQTPKLRISLVARLNTTEWAFGKKFLQTLYDVDVRLLPERVGNSEPIRTIVENIDDCEKYWAPSAIIDGPLGRSHVKWNFFWRRLKSVKCLGCIFHTSVNKFGDLKQGWITLSATPDKKVDWILLFSRLSELTNSKYATMHIETSLETRIEAYHPEVVENFGVNDFIYGVPDVALNEKGPANICWANFFGEKYASEVDVQRLRENGFSVEPIGEGFLVTLTPSVFDVVDNFSLFSERRVALRNLFRPGLFRINEEPKPLPD